MCEFGRWCYWLWQFIGELFIKLRCLWVQPVRGQVHTPHWARFAHVRTPYWQWPARKNRVMHGVCMCVCFCDFHFSNNRVQWPQNLCVVCRHVWNLEKQFIIHTRRWVWVYVCVCVGAAVEWRCHTLHGRCRCRRRRRHGPTSLHRSDKYTRNRVHVQMFNGMCSALTVNRKQTHTLHTRQRRI